MRREIVIALHGLLVVGGMLSAVEAAVAQPNGCVLLTDAQNPTEKILRCGEYLAIHIAPGTHYQMENRTPPQAARLDSGALLIEFNGNSRQKNFQIQAPQAIASVRGTKWVVETTPERSSTFVISGVVSVARRNGNPAAELGPGEGADMTADDTPIVVKRWPAARVKALLARFGQ